MRKRQVTTLFAVSCLLIFGKQTADAADNTNNTSATSNAGGDTFHYGFNHIYPQNSDLVYLRRMVNRLKKDPTLKLKITSHGCAIGTDDANMRVSRLRANILEDYMMRHDIDRSRLIKEWKGESEPIADNESENGRLINRRSLVQLVRVSGDVAPGVNKPSGQLFNETNNGLYADASDLYASTNNSSYHKTQHDLRDSGWEVKQSPQSNLGGRHTYHSNNSYTIHSNNSNQYNQGENYSSSHSQENHITRNNAHSNYNGSNHYTNHDAPNTKRLPDTYPDYQAVDGVNNVNSNEVYSSHSAQENPTFENYDHNAVNSGHSNIHSANSNDNTITYSRNNPNLVQDHSSSPSHTPAVSNDIPFEYPDEIIISEVYSDGTRKDYPSSGIPEGTAIRKEDTNTNSGLENKDYVEIDVQEIYRELNPNAPVSNNQANTNISSNPSNEEKYETLSESLVPTPDNEVRYEELADALAPTSKTQEERFLPLEEDNNTSTNDNSLSAGAEQFNRNAIDDFEEEEMQFDEELADASIEEEEIFFDKSGEEKKINQKPQPILVSKKENNVNAQANIKEETIKDDIIRSSGENPSTSQNEESFASSIDELNSSENSSLNSSNNRIESSNTISSATNELDQLNDANDMVLENSNINDNTIVSSSSSRLADKTQTLEDNGVIENGNAGTIEHTNSSNNFPTDNPAVLDENSISNNAINSESIADAAKNKNSSNSIQNEISPSANPRIETRNDAISNTSNTSSNNNNNDLGIEIADVPTNTPSTSFRPENNTSTSVLTPSAGALSADGKVMKTIQFIDADTGQPIEGPMDIKTDGGQLTLSSNNNGEVMIPATSDMRGDADIFAYGYFYQSEQLSRDNGKQVIKLKRIANGSKIALKDLFFQKGTSRILPESFPELERLYQSMLSNPNIRVEVGGHINVPFTRPEDISERQLNISIDRAKAVYQYLINKGVDKKRLEFKGYGNAEMVFPQATTPEQKAQNRRVEIKIVR